MQSSPSPENTVPSAPAEVGPPPAATPAASAPPDAVSAGSPPSTPVACVAPASAPAEPVPPQQAAPAPAEPPPAAPAPAAPECAFVVYGPALEARLKALEAAIQKVDEQQGYLPMQIRQIGGKIESVTSAVSQPALRALLLGVISFSDLVELLAEKNSPAEGSPDLKHQRNYQMLNSQLRQLLQDNGVSPIDVSGTFDPQFHRVVGTQAAPEQQPGRIISQIRKGYTSGTRVLRYADVILSQ